MTTIAEYLANAQIQATPVDATAPGAPKVTVGIPEGWQQVPAGMFPGSYGVWTQPPVNGWADNAVLLVATFTPKVDARDLLTHAFADARQLPNWQDLETDTEDFDGHPSAGITGTYTVDPLTLWAYNRYIIVDSPNGQYLVQLTITTRTDSDGTAPTTLLEGLSISA
ncbi:LpqN/LpqT family lipoprotein [Nocardia sp. CDC153]|uniref:LpqN/LpqT family lipoprotein n=1 Tax=Nocardia sp. CDC153 TaxID=3112167 RepID=UPI002DB89EC3|nr:LpqN/LpqT family lipoprotein [Nocardia sp. CDC153]MEC3951870.1 LpqN/LpqT family lipoprotein [Nocardia sp. CDC153]